MKDYVSADSGSYPKHSEPSKLLATGTVMEKILFLVPGIYLEQDVREAYAVFFLSATIMRSSNSARMNKFDFTTEKIGSVHMTVFEIVAHRNVDNWI